MRKTQSWRDQFQSEIERAQDARQLGNEGKARVCARRAVGILIGQYLYQRGIGNPGPSLYDRLRLLQSLPDLSPEILEIIGHFLLRVNADHTLPGNYDLISEAIWLAEHIQLK
jgi:hypothetical protein